MIQKSRALSSPTALAAGSQYGISSRPDIPAPRLFSWSTQSFTSSADGSESIAYTLGKSHWNYCAHSKSQVEFSNPKTNLRFYAYSGYPGQNPHWWDWTQIPILALTNQQVGGQFTGYNSQPAINTDALASDGVASVWPQIEQHMGESVVNFAIDAHKLNSLARQADQIRLKLRWLLHDVRKHSGFSLYNMKTLLKTLSQSHLINQYAIKTTYDDLQGLSSALRKARAELKRLNDGAQRIHQRAVTIRPPFVEENNTVLNGGTWAIPYTSWQNGTWTTYRKVSYPVARFTTHVWFSYEMPDMSPRLAEAAALADSIGLNLNPRILWDALKYSFVVDWVLRVGDFLDQFKRPWVKPVVKVHHCWTVLHYQKVTEIKFGKSGALYDNGTSRNDPASVITPTAVATGTYEYFIRKPSNYGFQALRTSGLSKYEIVMAASLFGARLKD